MIRKSPSCVSFSVPDGVDVEDYIDRVADEALRQIGRGCRIDIRPVRGGYELLARRREISDEAIAAIETYAAKGRSG